MRGRRSACAATIAMLGALAGAGTAHAGPDSERTAIVALGDSFISGEAGRWQGNSNDQLGSRDGTDRAWVRTWYGGFYDDDRVYLGNTDDGCHRSDVAEIRTAAIAVDDKINLACSGAVTSNVFRAAAGGQARHGEAPQADQLATVAQQKDVELVVLSVGGNDLGFADVIAACATAWTISTASSPRYCRGEQQANVDARMPRAMADVGKAIDEVRTVMRGAGYADGGYRLVLQSYPSPVPRGSENRYAQTGMARLTTGGCPFWDGDSTWARDSLTTQIADELRRVAAGRGVQFLDLRDFLQGREVCAKGTSLATDSAGPSAVRSEWTRFLVSGIGQGSVRESFHPNAYAQRALGRCLTLLYARTGAGYTCRTTPGAGVESAALAPLATATTARRHTRAAEARRAPYRPASPPRYPSRRGGRG